MLLTEIPAIENKVIYILYNFALLLDLVMKISDLKWNILLGNELWIFIQVLIAIPISYY